MYTLDTSKPQYGLTDHEASVYEEYQLETLATYFSRALIPIE